MAKTEYNGLHLNQKKNLPKSYSTPGIKLTCSKCKPGRYINVAVNTLHGIHRIINWFVQKVPRGTGQQRVGTQPCPSKDGHTTMLTKGRAHNHALQSAGTQSIMSAEGETLQKSIKPFYRLFFYWEMPLSQKIVMKSPRDH